MRPKIFEGYDEDEQNTAWTILGVLAERVKDDEAKRAALFERFLRSCLEWYEYEPWTRYAHLPAIYNAIVEYVSSARKFETERARKVAKLFQ